MLIALLAVAAILGITFAVVRQRHTTAVARIEDALRAVRATAIEIRADWLDHDRDTLTYDVTYTDRAGRRQQRRCKVAVRIGSDDGLYWSPAIEA